MVDQLIIDSRNIYIQWNPNFSNPQFFKPPNNMNQKWFPSSVKLCNFTPDFSNYPIFRTNFRFPGGLKNRDSTVHGNCFQLSRDWKLENIANAEEISTIPSRTEEEDYLWNPNRFPRKFPDWAVAVLKPGRTHSVVFLGQTLYSHSASLHPVVQMGTGAFNAAE